MTSSCADVALALSKSTHVSRPKGIERTPWDNSGMVKLRVKNIGETHVYPLYIALTFNNGEEEFEIVGFDHSDLMEMICICNLHDTSISMWCNCRIYFKRAPALPLPNGVASAIWNSHLISDTNCRVDLSPWAQRILRHLENSFSQFIPNKQKRFQCTPFNSNLRWNHPFVAFLYHP